MLQPGLQPTLYVIAEFFMAALKAGLIALTVNVAVTFAVIALIGSLLPHDGFQSLTGLISFVAAIVTTWFTLRFGMVLPAAAVGNRIGMFDSWRATAPLARNLIGVALAIALFVTLTQKATLGLAVVSY